MDPRGRVPVLWVLNPVELRAIAGFLRVLEFAPLRERVEAGGGDAIAVGLGVFDQRPPDLEQRVTGVVRGFDQRRLGLDDELEQFVIQAVLENFGRVVFVDEFVGPAGGAAVVVDDETLLLDPQRPHARKRFPRPAFHRALLSSPIVNTVWSRSVRPGTERRTAVGRSERRLALRRTLESGRASARLETSGIVTRRRR